MSNTINNQSNSILKVEGNPVNYGLKVTEIKSGASLQSGIYQGENGFFQVEEGGETKSMTSDEARAAFDDNAPPRRIAAAKKFGVFFQSSVEANLRFC